MSKYVIEDANAREKPSQLYVRFANHAAKKEVPMPT